MTYYCFIATAAYGSELADKVQFLREYREAVVKGHPIGKRAVRFFERIYYSFSPSVARWISRSDMLRQLTRFFVADPIVDLLMFGVYLFKSGKRRFGTIRSNSLRLKTGIFSRGIGSILYSTGWASWNIFLVASIMFGAKILIYAGLCWLPMGLGLFLMYIGNQLHRNIKFTPLYL